MEITFIGHASFKLKNKHAVVVTDPFSPASVGMKFPSLEADVVTISHDHEDHNAKSAVAGTPLVVQGPGEYEVKGIRIRGVPTFHDQKKGAERGKNTAYVMEVDGIVITHLGDIGHDLDDPLREAFQETDVLLVPVGGIYTVSAKEAASIVRQLEPLVVIPMHYRTEKSPPAFASLSPVSDFIKEMGKENSTPQQKLTLTKEKLPLEQTLVVLA